MQTTRATALQGAGLLSAPVPLCPTAHHTASWQYIYGPKTKENQAVAGINHANNLLTTSFRHKPNASRLARVYVPQQVIPKDKAQFDLFERRLDHAFEALDLGKTKKG